MSTKLTRTLAAVSATAASLTAAGATAFTAPAEAAPASPAPAAAQVRATTGWAALELAPAKGTGNSIIQLVSPAGVRTTVLSVPQNEGLIDISNDGRRILTGAYTRTAEVFRVRDLVAHTTTSFVANYDVVRFTNPSGQALLAQGFDSHTRSGLGNVVRLDLRGKRVVTYTGTTGPGYLPSATGAFLIGTDATNHLTVSANASGVKLRTLPKPAGYDYCVPQRNVSATSVTGSCVQKGTNKMQIFRWAITGGAPIAITSKLQSQPYGYSYSWNTAAGQAVAIAPSCGPAVVGLVRGTKVNPLPFVNSGDGSVADIVGAKAWVVTDQGCGDGHPSVVIGDVRTNKTVVAFDGFGKTGRRFAGLQIVDPMA